MKFNLPIYLFLSFLFASMAVAGQETNAVNASWSLNYHFTGKDSLFDPASLKLQSAFPGEKALNNYLVRLPQTLYDKGFLGASIDSVSSGTNQKDIFIFLGKQYKWISLNADSIEPQALESARFLSRNFDQKTLSVTQWNALQNRILGYYANNGYPFAEVYLDSIELGGNRIAAALKLRKGVQYPIDSIRIIGKAKLNAKFLQHYLGIENGSLYNRDRLNDIDKRISELSFVNPIQPSDLTMLGTSAVVNLYLEPKKSSQVNFLIGFLPAAGQEKKFQLTGDVNLDLKNMLGYGESILIKWQQLQAKSPRLNLGYNHPYIFNSAFGLDFLFDLFKKDSSFLQVNAQFGADYQFSAIQSMRIFIQWQSSSLLQGGVDTNQIRITKKLPPNIDVKSTNVGISYLLQHTNYKYNPRKGTETDFNVSVGTKKISSNNDIINLKDPDFDYATLYDSIKKRVYQLRAKISGAHFFPIGKLSTVKAGIQGGYYVSPSVFRNELFQVGGFKTLRGFDEESIYATRYAVLTAEYRNLLGLNSYLFFFADLGMVKNKYQEINVSNRFLGLGLGLVYETKVGLLNISYATGMRNDIPFNIREASKLHFGYVNYF